MKVRSKRYAAILSVVTVLALALSLVAVPMPTFAASTVKQSAFSDVKPTDPYANAFNALAAVGVYQGDQNGNANPTQQITRAEFAAVAVRLAGKAAVADSLQNQTPAFKDASQIPSWAWGSVNAASALGIINGYPDGTFRATNNVTEAEAAAMIIRVLGNDGAAKTGLWPANYMAVAQQLGLLNGVSTQAANVPATRADVAFMAYNALLATKKWDSATNSFDRDYAGLPLYYTNPQTGQPQQASPTTYGEAMGVMKEDPSWPSLNLAVASTVYLATATDLSAVQNQDIYAFQPFGGSAYSALVPSGNTSVVSGTINGLSNSYITVGGKAYPLGSSVTYSVNGTSVTAAQFQNLPDGTTSGNYSATLTLDSNGNVTVVAATRYYVNGFLTQALPASSSPHSLDEIQVSAYDQGSGTYDVTGAKILLNGQTATIADVQKALSDFTSAHSGQAISVKVAPPYDAATNSFVLATSTLHPAVAVVRVSTQTASGQIAQSGTDSTGGDYVLLSGQSNPIYLVGFADQQFNGSSNPFYVGANVTLLLDASGNAMAVLQSSAQQTDFYALLTKSNTVSNGLGGFTNTITVTLGDGSTATYTVDPTLGLNQVDTTLVGTPVYVTINPNTGYVEPVEAYTSSPYTDSGTIASVSTSYLSLTNGQTYVFAGTPFIFNATDTSFSNQLPIASLVVGQPVDLYLNSLGQVALIILPTPAAQVSSISVSPTSLTLTAGQTQQLKVTATLSDGTTQDVTSQAQYSSSDTSVATVSASGLVTAVAPGSATITVSYGGKSATVAVTVTVQTALSSVQSQPGTGTITGSVTVAPNTTAEVRLYNSAGTLVDFQDFTQSGSFTFSGLTSGIYTVALYVNGSQVQSQLVKVLTTSSLQVAQGQSVSLIPGATQQLTVTATLSDGTTKDVTSLAQYSSSDQSVATVSASGIVTAVAPGTATITVSYGGQSTTVTVDVAGPSSITATPSSATLTAGATLQLKVTATYSGGATQDVTSQAQYTSNTPGVATVSASGLVTAVATGTAAITVTYGGQSTTVDVTVQ